MRPTAALTAFVACWAELCGRWGAGFVEQLPKTRSGKVLRKNIRGLADGKPVPVPGTIDNPEAMDIVVEGLATLGYPEA